MLRLSRVYILYIFIIFVSLVFVGKLFLTQIVHGASYSERANKQYFLPVQNAFDRGSIYLTQRDGTQISAATLQSGYTIAINPGWLTDPEGAYTKLSALIPTLDRTSFMTMAAKKNDPYEVVATRVDGAVGEQIQAQSIAGVGVYADKWRFYPGGSLASQVLGFVGYNTAGNALAGRAGLELSYADVLARDTPDLYVNFFAEVFGDLQTS